MKKTQCSPAIKTVAAARKLFSRCTALAVLVGSFSSANAVTYYQVVNQNGGGSWVDTAAWNSAANGTGTAPVSISAADDFISNTNSWVLRTPTAAATFGGKSLTLGPSSHQLLIKGGTSTIAIAKLITKGAALVQNGANTSVLSVPAWVNSSDTTRLGNNNVTNALFSVSIGTLTGPGDFSLTGPATGTIKLSVTDAIDYEGTITLTSGKLEFLNPMSSAGELVVPTPANVTLNQAVTFTGLTVNGAVKAPGTYSALSLGFLGNGTVTVRTAATWYLTTNQAGAQDWTEAYLANWNSQANATGVAPASINIFDNYVNQGAGRELRTPTFSSTFGGGSLTLASTAKLTVKSPAGAVSTIPVLTTTGTPVIVNGYGNVREDVAVNDWEIPTGSTKLSAAVGRGLGLNIGYLGGAGSIQTQSGGAFYLKLNQGSKYTGTLDHASGSLRFENVLGTRGLFNVGSAATVNLDQYVYFTGLTVAGVTKPAGYHSYASLQAAHPAQFPAGTSAGAVAVYTPAAPPVTMHGVNLTGPEGGSVKPGTIGWDYIYPTVADFDYYHAKGLNLIRLPFSWERIQTTLNAPLNAAQLGYLDTAIARASARGMKVIIDLHNYGRYHYSSTGFYTLGDATLTYSTYANVWRQLADHYKNEPAIYGYDIMNEPNGLAIGVWISAAQSAINAIREVDLTHSIIVEGESWANAWDFTKKNPNLHTVSDPVGNLIFSAHSYWSNGGADGYDTWEIEGGDPMMGVNNVKPFVDWLKKYGFKGFVGEYGVPNTDLRWLAPLENFMAYLDSEGISSTYWASGPWYTNNLNCIPTSNYTVDKPVMSVLQNHP